MAWLWSCSPVASSLPTDDLLRSARYQNPAEGTNDAAQGALTRFRRGCARIATGYLSGDGARGSRQMKGPGRARRGRIAVHQAESKQRVRSKLRTTWAAAPDGAQAPAFSAWGSSLRVEPVS